MPLLRRIYPIALLLAALSLTACGSSPTATPQQTSVPETAPPTEEPTAELEEVTATPTADRPLAATVNGEPIYLVDYERQVSQYEAAMIVAGEDLSSAEGQERLLQARVQILNWMIEQRLIEQAAAEMGIAITDEQVDTELAQTIESGGGEAAFEDWLEQNGMTRQDAWRELRAEMIGAAVAERIISAVPESAEQVHARHILVATREDAEQILAQLQANADFNELARTYSLDENTRENGGDLGFFPRGVLMAPEIEEAAFSLQSGQISEVVQSSFGYHIVKVVEKDPNRPLSDESLRFLRERALTDWKDNLWAEAEVEQFANQGP
jgi:parvulin-like peptidyl-prolyl isomerase